MKRLLKVSVRIFFAVIAILLIGILIFNLAYGIINYRVKSHLAEAKVLNGKHYMYRDLNKNGRLDVYEDSTKNIEERVSDLLQQMNLVEKVGLMWHPPIGVGNDGGLLGKPSIFSFFSTYDMLINKCITHYNLFTIPKSEKLAEWYNNLQKIAEQTRLGIPVTISTDPRHGINNFISNSMLGSDFSKWPEPIGLAATGDSSLVAEFGKIANKEYRAVGIRSSLHPMADLATEPRWARINGTFGEDAKLASKMIAAYIYGFQGEQLSRNSVACMTKHWPGGGPQGKGEDAHFRYGADQVYPGDNFDYHILPFLAAFKAGTAMIMPYYGVPMNQTSENVGMSFNKTIITDLLRNKYGYDGVVCTDWSIIEGISILGYDIIEAKSWGVDSLSVKDRIKKVIDAGADQFGGNSNTELLLELVNEGKISETRINESVRRLLRVKFKLGLFDDPFVNSQAAPNIVGKKEFTDKGKLAQRKSIVLLKNAMNADSTFVLPLKKGLKIYVENIDIATANSYGNVVDSVKDAEFAILRLQAPFEQRNGDLIERMFHQGSLDFKEPELSRILKIMEKVPTIICIYLDRPAVMPGIVSKTAGLLCDFGAYNDAVLDIIFGNFNPSGKLPFEIPSSMETVRNQKEDVPYDSEKPLFTFGFGLTYKNIQ